MKARYFYIALTVLGVSIVSCTREEGNDTTIKGPALTFTAIHADSKDTKTALQDNGTSVWWTSTEQINIFYGTKFKGQFSSSNSEPQATTTFSGSLTVVTGSIESGAADAYWAVYPYDEANTCDGKSVTLTVPSAQTGVAGSFADNFFPAIATSTTLDLSFYNVCGGARFSVSQTGITSIKVSSKNATPIAGKVRVGFGANGKPEIKEVLAGESEVTLTAPAGGFVPGEYYFAAILPGTHTDGLDVVFEKDDNTMGTYLINKNIEVHRAVFGKLSDLDVGMTFGPNPKAPIQFADPIAKYACVEKFDTNGDGEVTYEEAAAATSLEGLFKDWDTVSSFEEIKYFTGVTSIANVFKGMKNLESITIPDNITDLGYENTFRGCTSLKTVVLPDNLFSISSYCFEGCSALTSVNLPSGITKIPSYCFQGCSSLVTVTLPSGIKIIEGRAFYGCSALESIEFPSGLEKIGYYAFCGCTKLTSVTIPSGAIYSNVFQQCSALSSVVLPADMTTIPSRLFQGCESLTSITWPDNVTSIGSYAFDGCYFASNNYTIEIPASITQIGSSAFSGLHHIIVPSTSAVSIEDNAFGDLGSYIYVPAGLIEMYKVRSNWNYYANRIMSLGDYPVEHIVGDLAAEAIDLGLPSGVKWASFNLGATRPEEYGDYFAWGETEPYYEASDPQWSNPIWRTGKESGYSWASYKYETDNLRTKYGSFDNELTLHLEDDAAHIHWKGDWIMPTQEMVQELIDNCNWLWTTQKGIDGFLVTSNIEGFTDKSIFLPAAGGRIEKQINYVGVSIFYWTSTTTLWPYPTACPFYGSKNKSVRFSDLDSCCQGFSIRPVCK